MTDNIVPLEMQNIRDRIFSIRGKQVMLDRDLAELYQVETRTLNQAVKRNLQRFPDRFMFQLRNDEFDSLRSQIVILEKGRGKYSKYLPYAFTEQGIAMLSAILRSDIAINVSVKIMDAFVEMRKLILSNQAIFNRLDRIELKQLESDQKFEKIFKAIEDKNIKPEKGIFFEGQIFDAYVFVSKLIKQAKKTIVLIDNYVDESVLTLLSKRSKHCAATVYTKELSKKLILDLKKHNEQYDPVEIKIFKHAHDRFLILDNNEIYHIGASLKDLGKKWFGFSKFDKGAFDLLQRLEHIK